MQGPCSQPTTNHLQLYVRPLEALSRGRPARTVADSRGHAALACDGAAPARHERHRGGSLDDGHDERDAGHDPLGGGLLALERGGEDEGGAALLRLVARADVEALVVDLVARRRLDLHHGQLGVELLHVGLLERAGGGVPARALDDEAVDVRALARGGLDLLGPALGHLDGEADLVERPLVLARGHLQHGGEEGLRVEEARDPRALGRRQVARPVEQLLLPLEQVDEPHAERQQARVGEVDPVGRRLVVGERLHERLHRLGDGEVAAQAGVELAQGAAHLEEQQVHALGLLQEDGGVRRALVDALLDLHHDEEVGQLLEDVVEHLLGALRRRHRARAAAAAARLQVGDAAEEVVGLRRHEVDLGVRVQPVGRGRLALDSLLDVLEVALERGDRRRRGEARVHLDALDELLAHVGALEGRAQPAVPVVRDVPAVHDLAEEVAQVGPRDLGARLEVVVRHAHARDQVALVERVAAVPALRPELAPLAHDAVEEAEREDDRLELGL
eukprot:scaffold80980_cov54-Phaeocystis_antarctica.AAC.1